MRIGLVASVAVTVGLGPVQEQDAFAAARDRMVERHWAERGIKDPRVPGAVRTVPRHRFVSPEAQHLADEDESIPIGGGQTITPPFDVAFLTEGLAPTAHDRDYEVGTGSS